MAVGLTVCVLVMILGWIYARNRNNYSYVDALWALNMGLLALVYSAQLDGYPLRKLIILGLVSLWSYRLSWHLFRRIHGRPEESRYQQLRLNWRTQIPGKFLLFFLAQALLNVLLSAPMALAMLRAGWIFSALEVAGYSLFVLALIGEHIADRQLQRFKMNPENRGKVCEDGLWAYSRHPNYFFDWLSWVALALMATFAYGSSNSEIALWSLAAWLAPALMLYFFLFVTGIPPTEAQSLAHRGDAYRDYQRRVSAFFPWFPRSP